MIRKLKVLLSDLKDFVWYLVTEPWLQLYVEVREASSTIAKKSTFTSIWDSLTSKKSWVIAWFVLFIIFAWVGIRELMMLSFAMFVVFYLVWLWQLGEWKYRARQRIKKRAKKLQLKQ